MKLLAIAWLVALLAACATPAAPTADAASDAPEGRIAVATPLKDAPDYAAALRLWNGADDVNAWIAARFQYDMARALQLSETQRTRNGRMPITAPAAFHAAPRGVCVDLSRFAVETLRAIDPAARPRYLTIEFDPVTIAGNTLRRHWLVVFERDGGLYFFADSKRPGYMAGPYARTEDFIADYARYRGRTIVSFREAETYERRMRTMAVKEQRR